MISSRLKKTETLDFYVRPNAASSRVEGLHDGKIKVRISASPEKGRANKALLDLISGITGIPRSNMAIISGITSNYKKIMIEIRGNKSNVREAILGKAEKNR